jgi:hypothetical protein
MMIFTQLSLSNGIFCKRPLEENIAEVKRLGFKNLEFNMKSVEVEDDASVHTAKKLVDDCGLKCLTLHAATLARQRPGGSASGSVLRKNLFRVCSKIVGAGHGGTLKHLAETARISTA